MLVVLCCVDGEEGKAREKKKKREGKEEKDFLFFTPAWTILGLAISALAYVTVMTFRQLIYSNFYYG